MRIHPAFTLDRSLSTEVAGCMHVSMCKRSGIVLRPFGVVSTGLHSRGVGVSVFHILAGRLRVDRRHHHVRIGSCSTVGCHDRIGVISHST